MPSPRTHLLLFLLLLLAASSCQMAWRGVRYNKPNLDDYELWDERPVRRSGQVHGFVDGTAEGIPALEDWAQGKEYKEGMEMADFFRKTGTQAFVVLRGDTLLYEYYAPKASPETRFNSFSMAKPYVATLIGIALHEGHIASIHQAVGDFLPEFTDTSLCALKISHLLQMTSGLKTSEGFLNPWATTAKLYYGADGLKEVEKAELERMPGTKWRYQNINIQILGMVLEKATGRSVAEYLEEKIWGPMGMEGDAGWSLHEADSVEKSFCCLNARARDFGRFGLMLMQNGKWEGKQIVPEQWIKQCTVIDTAEGARQKYQYTFYTTVEQEDFYLQGLLGQFTYIAPSTRTVIVRIGSKINPSVPWYDMFKYLSGTVTKPKPVDPKPEQLKALEGTWTFGLSNFSDSLMWGKQAHFKASNDALIVSTNFNKTWEATPSSDSTYFDFKYARRLLVRFDKSGQPAKIKWTRRGNAWWLTRTAEP